MFQAIIYGLKQRRWRYMFGEIKYYNICKGNFSEPVISSMYGSSKGQIAITSLQL